MRNLEVARHALSAGVAPVPCRPGTKIPMVPWKRFETELPAPEEVERLFADTRVNICVVCTGRVIFDCDDPAKAELVLKECGPTPHMLRTPRGGVHLGYRKRKGVEVKNLVRVKGEPIDIRTDGGLEMIPNSVTEHGEYAWLGAGLLPAADLPVARIGWTRERIRRVVIPEAIDDGDRAVRRARGYLAAVEGTATGEGGCHDKTFRLACVLIHKFGLTVEQAMPLFCEWNQKCKPPWGDSQLRHKLTDAFNQKRGA